MKKIVCMCLTAIIFSALLPVCIFASDSLVSWSFEKQSEAEEWERYLVSVSSGNEAIRDTVEDYFSFSTGYEEGNSFGSFKYINPPSDSNLAVRYKRDFDTPVTLPQDGHIVISCRVKLTGEPFATYQLRAFTSAGQQEVLMGLGQTVSLYRNHGLIKTENEVYCDFDAWHKVEIIISGKDKSMLHYFDGHPVSGEAIPLYTFSDGSQFAGPYNSLAIVCYSNGNSAVQEFMLDDVSVYLPETGALESSSPLQGSMTADPAEPITLTFNQYIDETSLADAEVTINGEEANVSLDTVDRKTCVVTPGEPLAPAAAYQVSAAGLKDIFGNDLSASVQFTTRDGIYVEDVCVLESDTAGGIRNVTNAALSGGTVSAEVTLSNEAGKDGSAVAALALYNETGLARCHISEPVALSTSDAEKTLTVQMTLTEQEAQTHKLKLFVFDEMSNLMPLMNPWQSRSAYFVSPNGSDGNSGSYSTPFKTLEKAVRTVRAGDTVIFEDGEYTETRIATFENGGSADAPIILRARNKGKAKIVFASSENDRLKTREKINIPNTTSGYITIRDLVLTQDAAATENDGTTKDIFINCRASNCSFIGNEIYHCYEEPIKAAGVSGILLEDNVLYDSVHEGIDFVNVSDSIIRNNTISEIQRVGVMVKGGSRNIQVYNNTVYNETKSMDAALSVGGSTDSQSTLDSTTAGFEGYNQYFWNNVVYEAGTGSVETGVLFSGSKDSMAFNNTIFGCTYAIHFVNAPGTKKEWEWDPINKNARIYNNLIVEADKGIYKEDMPENLISDFNLFYDCSEAPALADEPNSIIGSDPLFIDAAAGDFMLQSSSPAHGKGVVLSGQVAGYDNTQMSLDLSDRIGANRGISWTIGAYQLSEN